MSKFQIAICCLLIGILRVPCYGDAAKDAYKLGVRADREGKLDDACTYYKQAHTLNPSNAKYFADYTRMRFNAAAKHTHDGQALVNTGSLTEALAEFQKAVELDSSSFVSQQELRRTADLIRRKERQRAAPETHPAAKSSDVGRVLELQPLSNGAITLHLAVNADMAYKTIGKLAGINVLIDPEFKGQRITLDLNDVTLREALDMVRLQSKSYWRPVLANTIFVTSDSPSKRKDLEQNVMKTFYLKNLSTPAELQEAANVLKQILDVGRVQLLQGQDALIVRGTPDQMILAEKLLADVDKPKSEVIIDVSVMQVRRDRIRNLGTNVPTTASIGVVPPGSGGAAAIGGFAWSNFVFSISGGSFTALASDSKTKILQSPEVRTLNDEKATLRIGDRVPIATGSFQPGIVGGGGVSPLVSTQFTYLDVGVNIDITPHIHAGNEVTLKMMLEISSVTGSQNIGGITQPIIGQRRIEHEIRLVDGEVNLLGGILEDSETQSLSGYPWISKLPLLKYLFGQENKERSENEIVFAITPHVIRSKDVTEENTREIEIGTGNSIELRKQSPHLPPDATHPALTAPQAPPAAQTSPQSSPQIASRDSTK